jgi:crotonobetainyl-CoA:carnitine CoA-transferase CaiB-like acyl-CoA transferase
VAQKVETSLFGSMIAAQAWELQYYILSRRLKRAGRGHAYLPTIWRTFRTKDGWAVVGGVGDDRWPAFCAAVAMPELQHDERFANALSRNHNLPTLYELLDDKFLAKTTAEWIAVLEEHDMICAPAADYALRRSAGARQRVSPHRGASVERADADRRLPVEVQRDACARRASGAGTGAAHGGDPALARLHVGADRGAAGWRSHLSW